MEPMKPMEPMQPMQGMKPMEPMKWAKPWWPEKFGSPNSSGGQNEYRYAYFGDSQRLVVDHGGKITVYDTGDHRISGISQQQSNANRSARFTSQLGDVTLDELNVVNE